MSPAILKIRQRHFLKSKDKKIFFALLANFFPGQESQVQEMVSSKSRIEWVKLDQNQELYAVDGVLAFWLKEGKIIPLLSFLRNHDTPFKTVHVDLGAIKFVAKGADVMRPGITTIDSTIEKGDVVLIKDPNHNQVLAVGEALYDAPQMQAMDTGKVIKAIHSITDNIWAFSKDF
jgi:PUA domain protein